MPGASTALATTADDALRPRLGPGTPTSLSGRGYIRSAPTFWERCLRSGRERGEGDYGVTCPDSLLDLVLPALLWHDGVDRG